MGGGRPYRLSPPGDRLRSSRRSWLPHSLQASLCPAFHPSTPELQESPSPCSVLFLGPHCPQEKSQTPRGTGNVLKWTGRGCATLSMLKAIVLNTRWVSCVVCELHLKAVKDLVSMVGVGETGEGEKLVRMFDILSWGMVTCVYTPQNSSGCTLRFVYLIVCTLFFKS